jgi:hypothetical protein
MLRDLDGRKEVRVPSTEWFNLYRRAAREVPHLVEAMYAEVDSAVQRQGDARRFNSTQLGGSILPRWSRKEEWDGHFGDESVSGALFGQIMWTYFFDDPRDWHWVKTARSITAPEEREYFLTD